MGHITVCLAPCALPSELLSIFNHSSHQPNAPVKKGKKKEKLWGGDDFWHFQSSQSSWFRTSFGVQICHLAWRQQMGLLVLKIDLIFSLNCLSACFVAMAVSPHWVPTNCLMKCGSEPPPPPPAPQFSSFQWPFSLLFFCFSGKWGEAV